MTRWIDTSDGRRRDAKIGYVGVGVGAFAGVTSLWTVRPMLWTSLTIALVGAARVAWAFGHPSVSGVPGPPPTGGTAMTCTKCGFVTHLHGKIPTQFKICGSCGAVL